ncbi:MAG: hypothetical protein A2Y33_05815 [Spirochaetes bacterium GWF1_51_8]|nr:MAG: hypothetical protein A2Y33_05815 [Spirochaetes bacterium GWF1_51_8]
MKKNFFERLAEFSTRNSLWIIIGTIVLTVGVGLCILRLEMNNDLLKQVSPASDIGYYPHHINETFGGVSPLIIVIESDGIFTHENLTLIRNITRLIESMDGIENVISITDTKDLTSNKYGIVVDDMFKENIPTNANEIEAKKKYILSKDMYIGRLISADGKYAMVLVTAKGGNRIDKISLEIQKRVDELVAGKNVKLYYGGSPTIMNALSEVVAGDLIILVPFVALIVAGVLFMSFGRIRGVILPLTAVGFATIIAIGIMGVFKVNFTMIGSAIPVVLIAVGNAYGIHVMAKYYEETSKGITDPLRLTHMTVRDVGMPILMAGLTTFFGFVSIIISDLQMIQDFGIYTSIGVVLALVITLLFIPAMLSRMKPQLQKIAAQQEGKNHKIGKFAEFLSRTMVERKVWVLIVFGAIAALCISQFYKLYPEMDYLSYFNKDSKPVEVSKVINDHFGGYSAFSIYLKGDMTDSDIQKTMVLLEEKAKSIKKIAAMGGVHGMISELNSLWSGIKTIPDTKGEIENLWFFIDGQPELKSMVTKDKTEGVITFLLPSVSSGYEKQIFGPLKDYVTNFQGAITMAPVYYTNERLVRLVALMLSNAYAKEGKITLDIASLEELALSAGNAVLGFEPFYPAETLYKYLSGPECEITLSGQQAGRIVSKLKTAQDYSVDGIYKAILPLVQLSADVTTNDIAALADSLAFRYAEDIKLQRYNFAVEMVYQSMGIEIDRGRLMYAVAPMFWHTMPVERDYAGPVANTAPIETLEVSGYAYLISQLKERLFTSQMASLILALVAVLILNSLTFRSALKGLVSITAVVFTLVVNFGVMGVLGIPLDLVTVTIASIAIGTGIDYSIHFTSRFSLEMERNGGDEHMAAAVTLSTTGLGILANALAVGLGFVVLLISGLSPIRTLGMLLAISMLVSSLSALTLLPVMYKISGVFRVKEKTISGGNK